MPLIYCVRACECVSVRECACGYYSSWSVLDWSDDVIGPPTPGSEYITGDTQRGRQVRVLVVRWAEDVKQCTGSEGTRAVGATHLRCPRGSLECEGMQSIGCRLSARSARAEDAQTETRPIP